MNPEMEIGTDKKALRINLEASKYGTFAEIGAGQEVARRFFRVGGAAGTIAKTMSAYDMTFSDAIYGPADRYVSRVRLQTMLDHEYALLVERLDQKLGAEKRFSFLRTPWQRAVLNSTMNLTDGLACDFSPRNAAHRARLSSMCACLMKPTSNNRKPSVSSA